MKVMLLFPPHWTPAMPHLALPTLTAFLRERGVEVIQRDLNLEIFEALLTRRGLEQAVARLGEGQRARPGSPVGAASAPPERVDWALNRGPEVAARVDDAVRVIRSPAFLDGPRGVEALLAIGEALEIASLPFYPASLELTRFLPPAPVDSSRALLHAARDPRRNMFLELFTGVVHDIEREQPQIVGISVCTMDQMLPAATLGHLIRERGLPCHVTVGGPHISMLREQVPRARALFDLWDSAVVFDGAEPLARLAEALEAGGDLSSVPNLIYRDGDRVRVNPVKAYAPEPALMPDFGGLPLGRYLVPFPVLPLATSRGCYHGRCAFCNVGYGAPVGYHRFTTEAVVKQMRALHRRYGVRHIFFADEVIAPHTLREMSEALEELGSPLHWCGCARLERALTGELLSRMAAGGCRMLLFGLESASRHIVQRMRKGTTPEEASRVLRESAEAGIWNHVFFFFGFPGETLDDAQETVNFVFAHRDAIHSASPGAFLLERYAPVHRSPASFGVTRIIDNRGADLAIHFDYEVALGMGEDMAELVVQRFLDVLPVKEFGQYYVSDAHRFTYASDLCERRQPMPVWLASGGPR
ncbi:MAG: B12-binding domain-containing radical SAM protein [Anaerolineae bacterium]|nr:B12-binding domain-containing radical SAM protein [Anaerolineae bacterium]